MILMIPILYQLRSQRSPWSHTLPAAAGRLGTLSPLTEPHQFPYLINWAAIFKILLLKSIPGKGLKMSDLGKNLVNVLNKE